ncbi:MAG: nitrile hydratase subunit beta [Caldimonas sp.]
MSYTTHADLGGQPGHGPVTPEPKGDPFHAVWEPRAMAVTLAMGATGMWNIDISRAARETLPGYATLSYYEIWFDALVKLIEERGLADAGEIASGHMHTPPRPVAGVLHADAVAATLERGSPTERAATSEARFAAGARVRMRSNVPDHHTRLPAYVRGCVGVIERVHGTHVFADAHALGLGEQPQWLYNVVFDEAELWPGRAAQGLRVSVDAWEPYLEAAP